MSESFTLRSISITEADSYIDTDKLLIVANESTKYRLKPFYKVALGDMNFTGDGSKGIAVIQEDAPEFELMSIDFSGDYAENLSMKEIGDSDHNDFRLIFDSLECMSSGMKLADATVYLKVNGLAKSTTLPVYLQ